MFFACLIIAKRICPQLFLLFLFLLFNLFTAPVNAEETETTGSEQQTSATIKPFQRFQFVFEPDAYYSDVNLIIALTREPIPQLGELSESAIYKTLLSRAALFPQFLVLEASINPLPYAGTYIREHEPALYRNAQISGSFNWVKALTAGFEEPWAVSLLAGNVANFHAPDSNETKGLGYSGYLFSTGNYHIKDNILIKDDWREIEWKMKGDRKSSIKKLSWSFRVGAKLHGNPDITDIVYLSVRRSRLDYKPEGNALFNNSGFEYTFDMDRRTLGSIRHYLFVDKKWPLENMQMAMTLAAGFVWESAKKYTGTLSGRDKDDFQIIFRPNIEF